MNDIDITIEVKIKPEWRLPAQSIPEKARRSMVKMKFKKLAFETERLIKTALINVMQEYQNEEDADG